jgi:5S rRNA maturation endonuclease (ribonuclease M5)
MNTELQSLIINWGIEVRNISGNEIHCLCPFHQDNRVSFSINSITGKWICFRGCGKGSLETLAARLGKTIEDFYIPDSNLRLVLDTDISDEGIDFFRRHVEGISPSGSVSGKKLIGYMKSRGVHYNTVNEFDIRISRDGEIMYPVKAPYIGTSDRVMGILMQRIGEKAISPGFEKSNYLYGMCESKKWTGEDTFVICEGPIDLLHIYQAGYAGGALMGSSISDRQVQWVLSTGIDDIVIFTDYDLAGVKCAKEIVDKLVAKGVLPSVVRWQDIPNKKTGSDPGELSRREIRRLVENAERISLL